MLISRKFRTSLIALCLTGLAASASAATRCESLPDAVKDARRELRHASAEADLDRATHYARRANRALDAAADGARSCACDDADKAFRRAVSDSRRARSARDTARFSTAIKRALRNFDAANDALRVCERTH